MNSGGGSCGEPRSCHCTPVWVTRAKLHLNLKKKKKRIQAKGEEWGEVRGESSWVHRTERKAGRNLPESRVETGKKPWCHIQHRLLRANLESLFPPSLNYLRPSVIQAGKNCLHDLDFLAHTLPVSCRALQPWGPQAWSY